MRFLGSRHRGLPKFVWRRMDRVAGALNTLLSVVALSLVMLNLLYVAKRLVDAPPPVAAASLLLP